MALGPIDYSLDVQTPFQAALQGYQAGAAIRNDQRQQQQQQAALEQQQRQQQLLANLAAKQNATADDYAAVMTQIPSLAENLQKAWSTKNAAQQQAAAGDMLRWGAAIKSGQPQIAADELDRRAEQLENAGGAGVSAPTPESRVLRAQAQLVRDHPQFALGQFQATLSVNPNGKDAAEALAKFGAEARSAELQPSAVTKAAADASKAQSDATTAAVTADFARPTAQAELDQKAAQLGLTKAQVRDINSQIGNRAAQLGLDRQKLQLEVDKFAFEKLQKAQDIGQDGRKLVNDSAVAAGAAKLSADRANDLANRITDIGSSWGSAGTFAEWLKRTTGEQGAVSQLRSEYTRLRNSEGLKNLPPGPATDKDIELALKGIPPETADPKVLQQFLRGVAKMNDINAAIENAKADFASNNKGLLRRAGSDFSAGGVDVKAGEDWTSVSKRVAAEAAKGYRPALPPAAAPAEPGASIRPPAPAPSGRPPLDSFFTPGT